MPANRHVWHVDVEPPELQLPGSMISTEEFRAMQRQPFAPQASFVIGQRTDVPANHYWSAHRSQAPMYWFPIPSAASLNYTYHESAEYHNMAYPLELDSEC